MGLNRDQAPTNRWSQTFSLNLQFNLILNNAILIYHNSVNISKNVPFLVSSVVLIKSKSHCQHELTSVYVVIDCECYREEYRY